jgi:hypothetical protein
MIESLGKRPRKQPIKSWVCEGDHMYRYFPHIGERVKTIHNVQQDDTIEDMGRSMLRIYVALDNKQVEFQSHMIEVEGKINDQPIYILIDSGSIHSYNDPNIVERFHFQRRKQEKYWLVQVARGAKRRINELVKDCPMDMNELRKMVYFNIIPLDSYDCLIGMDWLDKNHSIL